MNGLLIVIAAVAAIILLLIVTNIRIVPQSRAWVMERIGVYSKTWHTGLHIKFPIIEKPAKKVDLREQILVCGEGFNHGQYHNHKNGFYYERGNSGANSNYNEAYFGTEDIAASSKRTRGGDAQVGVGIDVKGLPVAVKAAVSSKSDKDNYISNKTGAYGYFENTDIDANASFVSGRVAHNRRSHSPQSQPVITKDNVSMEMDTVVFYQITDPKLYTYGHANPLKAIEHLVATSLRNIVGGLELDETLTSRELINSKIRVVLDEVTDAWGIKITRVELKNIIISDVELAEAMEKQMIAERTKRAQILRAEGISQAEILEAQGKAEAIRLVNEAKPSQEFLTIRALEAYEKAADGQATKIIVPSNLQSLAGLALSGSEVFKEGEKMGE
jgi:regulator of protease activity HflC (stomatin/prohibitin superfamily)